MKGFKAAAFVQLNGHHDKSHVINNHHHRFSFVNISSHHQHMIATTRRRRYWHQSSLQSTADDNSEDEIINIIANDNANGIFLDLDTYLQAEETLLRPDGSLSENNSSAPTTPSNNEAYQSAMQGLFPPTYSYLYPDTKNEQDLSDEELLLQSVTDIQNDKSAMTQQQQLMDAETLHQQVFAEEQVYLEQSEEFRKSLSNNLRSSDDNYETPMARGRREAVEEYNQGILNDLLREIEEMEANAISREDALSRAQSSGNCINNNDDDDVMDVTSSAIQEGSSSAGRFCSQCGLPVTPDMTQRAKYGPQKLLCQACYGIKFRVKNEADVRLAQGPTVWETNNNRMSDQKTKKSNSRRTRLDTSRMNRGSVLDTSSLFRIPDSRMPNEQMPDGVTETPLTREVDVSMRLEDGANVSRSDSGPPPTRNQPTPIKPSKIAGDTKPGSGGSAFRSKENNAKKQSTSKAPMKQERRSTSSRLLGGRELERRKTQHISDDNDVTNLPGPLTGSTEKQQVDDDIIEEEAAPEQESSNEWIKVEDSTTKRIMYWNKQTGEMKRSIE